MKLIAVALPAGLVALALSALSGEDPVQRGSAIDATADDPLSRYGDALPPWHPPVSGERRALLPREGFAMPHGRAVVPHWHPPVPGPDRALPDGHPVCPAGRAQLDLGGSRRGPLDADGTRANPVISI